MNSPVFDTTISMTNSAMTYDYSYNSFWKSFSFSQVRPGVENWEEFSFFELPRMKNNENDVLPPLILQTASKESGFFLSEDAEDAIRKRSSKELARKFQEIREEKMREDAVKEEIELQAFIVEQKIKALKEKAEKALEPKKKKNTNFKFFKQTKPRKAEVVVESVEAVSARHSEIRKKNKNEKKILDKARAEFFNDSSLTNNEAWLVAIGEAIGMKFASRSIREIREKLNVSSVEKIKLLEKEDDITKVETSSLTDEQVSELNKAEKEDEFSTTIEKFINDSVKNWLPKDFVLFDPLFQATTFKEFVDLSTCLIISSRNDVSSLYKSINAPIMIAIMINNLKLIYLYIKKFKKRKYF